MFKFFLRRRRESSPDDPLAHPAIQAMSLDEIADLPLTPQWPDGCAGFRHRSLRGARLPAPDSGKREVGIFLK